MCCTATAVGLFSEQQGIVSTSLAGVLLLLASAAYTGGRPETASQSGSVVTQRCAVSSWTLLRAPLFIGLCSCILRTAPADWQHALRAEVIRYLSQHNVGSAAHWSSMHCC